MNVSTQIQVKNPVPSVSGLADKAPPGARTSPAGDRVELHHLAPQASAAEREQSTSLGPLKKTMLAVTLGLTAFGGLANAMPAYAAQPAQTTQTVQETLQVVVVPTGTPRVDLIPRTQGHDGEYEPYSEVGVYLGNGIFHDAHGNLSYLPTDASGWNPVISQFQRVDVDIRMGRDHNAARFGSTVHFNESSTKRHIFSNRPGDAIEQLNHRDRTEFVHEGDTITVTAGRHNRDGYTITREGDSFVIRQPGKQDITLTPGVALTTVRQNNRLIGRVTVLDEGRMRVETQRGHSTVMRSAGGAVLRVDGRSDFTLTREADGTIHTDKSGGDQYLTIDSQARLAPGNERYQTLVSHLQERDPNYVQRHPLVMSVLEYAAHNPGMLDDGASDTEHFLQAGTQISNAGGGVMSGVALVRGATALSLAEHAHALGAAALSAKAAAEAAAHAGNLSQAAALAGQAQELGNQARSLGSEAMRTGRSAQNSAQVAQVMLGVAATLEIIDGGFGVHEGASNRSLVEGAVAVAQARYDELRENATGRDLERLTEDYTRVMNVLNTLEKNADKQITVGGLKIGCGSLLLISALLGPEAPVALGAAGIACTVGTSVYEHWDQIESFFDKDADPSRPNILDILPDDQVIIRLDDGRTVRHPR